MAVLLPELPAELLYIIASYLPNKSVKALRLTCRTLCSVAPLRLDRVFISANPLNIAVFRAVADSETFRYKVTEIIYDDARLMKPPEPDTWNLEGEDGYEYGRDLDTDEDDYTCSSPWFMSQLRRNKADMPYRRGGGLRAPEDPRLAEHRGSELAPALCWQYYQNLLQQQEDVIFSRRDVEAFVYGLRKFPNLKRITLTPAAHGHLWGPLYETPMIRAFPRGFNYPIPRGWPTGQRVWDAPQAQSWEDAEVRNEYRGFSIITRALAEYAAHHISELTIDANSLPTGLNCRVFEEPNTEYNDFATLLRRPGFRRLDLALLVGGQERTGWRCYRSRLLSRALANSHGLEHLTLTTTVDVNLAYDDEIVPSRNSGSRAQFVPLCTILPVENFHSLAHFGLCNFLVDKDDVIDLLKALSPTLRSLFLGHLWFVKDGGSLEELLEDMREKLDWRGRHDPAARPMVSFAVPTDYSRVGHAIFVEKEAHEFLYGDGPNPLVWITDSGSVCPPVGVVRDAFLPGVEWSNSNSLDLSR
ncbi:hypothetical protein BJX68DRAFT_279014 [Aspergillus pseudodeflectus]|uniref:F-box domain-containing protein n=1 Tax=Aspergillus pseudodeflectus TaxID=176178 RepID=A0ABR4JKR6_9EURO